LPDKLLYFSNLDSSISEGFNFTTVILDAAALSGAGFF
jgi:hypothetical protein